MHRKRGPGQHGPRAGDNLLDGDPIACKPVRDEPAHELDVDTLERLDLLPADDQGSVLLVRRDRACRNVVAAGTLVIEDDGLVIEQEAYHDGDLRQRAAKPACKSRPDPEVPGNKAADVPREQSRKLGWQERKELNRAASRLEQLEKMARDRHLALVRLSFHLKSRDEIGCVKICLGDLERGLAAACARRQTLEERAGCPSSHDAGAGITLQSLWTSSGFRFLFLLPLALDVIEDGSQSFRSSLPLLRLRLRQVGHWL
jgi:hypothetical protein